MNIVLLPFLIHLNNNLLVSLSVGHLAESHFFKRTIKNKAKIFKWKYKSYIHFIHFILMIQFQVKCRFCFCFFFCCSAYFSESISCCSSVFLIVIIMHLFFSDFYVLFLLADMSLCWYEVCCICMKLLKFSLCLYLSLVLCLST